jgi:hypothetical protein
MPLICPHYDFWLIFLEPIFRVGWQRNASLYRRGTGRREWYSDGTEQLCMSCHWNFIELNPFGRTFRLDGSTLSTGKPIGLISNQREYSYRIIVRGIVIQAVVIGRCTVEARVKRVLNAHSHTKT